MLITIINNKMVSFSEVRYLLLKITCGAIAMLLFSGSLNKLYEDALYYEQKLVCTYSLVASLIIIFTEFSPYILENFLVTAFPFLDSMNGKGIFYIILGTFLFDPTLNWLCYMSGELLLGAGLGWIVHSCLEGGNDS